MASSRGTLTNAEMKQTSTTGVWSLLLVIEIPGVKGGEGSPGKMYHQQLILLLTVILYLHERKKTKNTQSTWNM